MTAIRGITQSDLRELKKLADDLDEVARVQLNVELERSFAAAAELVKDDADRLVTSVVRSSRIGKTLRVTGSKLRWQVRAGSAARKSDRKLYGDKHPQRRGAPHAGLYEYGSARNPNTIRHPLFSSVSLFWGAQYIYETPTRPFLRPALAKNIPGVVAGVERATDRAFDKANL